MAVSDEELEARRAKWQPREPKVTTGYWQDMHPWSHPVTGAQFLKFQKQKIERGIHMELTGAQIVIECLKEQGVDTVFGYPGGAILNVYDELYKHRMRLPII